MTDRDLVDKKLAFIETCLAELRGLADADRIATDVKERRFVEHTLQLAIQATLDIASHVASSERLGEPTSNRALFALLASAGHLPREQLDALEAMAGFRNILVHGYTAVDPLIVRDVLLHHLDDLDAFVAALR